MFTQSKEFKKLQSSISKNNAARAELRNLLEQGEVATQRSLEEVKWSLINLIGQLDAKRAV